MRISRSRKGAWIEIFSAVIHEAKITVAPVRERGLKCPDLIVGELVIGRSRKGAWIEIISPFCITPMKPSLP